MKETRKPKLSKKVVGLSASILLLGIGVTVGEQSNQFKPTAISASQEVKLGTEATFTKGQDIPFQVKYQIPADLKTEKLELYDPLEPVFEYQKAQVFDDKGNDVTDEGILDFDKATNKVSWQAKDAKKWFGRQMRMRVVAKLKDNADLSKYLDKNTNQYNIPNVGYLKINDDDTASNKVLVHTPNDKEPTVVKAVQDKNGKYGDSAKYEIGDEFHYRVTYTVPKNGKDISNVTFEDDLEDVLDLKDVKVTDDKGNDITKSDGDLKIDNEKESFVWQPTKDYLVKMPDHMYTVDVTAKIKPNVDLTKYIDKASNQYQIPNIAKMKYNNVDVPSNKVDIITPPPTTKNKIVKSIQGLSGSFHEDKDNVELGKDYTYKVQYTPAQGKTLKDVEFSDDLEDVLDLRKVVVQNADGKDVTDSEGKLKIDDEKESFVWQPNDTVITSMGGKTYTVLITARIKENADLQKYIKNNVIEIPNTAYMKDSGEDTPSNTTIATPKTEQPKAKKGIVRDPSNWTKFFGNKAMTSASQSSNSDKVNRAIESNANDSKIKEAKSKVKQNKNGAYQKANSKVTDKEFKDALKVLSEPYKSETTVKINEQGGSNVTTTAPTSSDDLKSIISTTTVESNQAARGDAIDYLLTFDIGNNSDIKSLVLSDDLEDVLDLKNVVVLDSDGSNITNDGKLVTNDVDESWTWTATEPAKYSNKKVYVAVAANIKPNADLSSYTDKRIPNVAHMTINGQDTPTNVVHTSLNGKSTTGTDGGTPDKYKSVLQGDGSNNAVTGKNGLLPKTGHFVLTHKWLIIALISAIAAGLGGWLSKKKKEEKTAGNKK